MAQSFKLETDRSLSFHITTKNTKIDLLLNDQKIQYLMMESQKKKIMSKDSSCYCYQIIFSKKIFYRLSFLLFCGIMFRLCLFLCSKLSQSLDTKDKVLISILKKKETRKWRIKEKNKELIVTNTLFKQSITFWKFAALIRAKKKQQEMRYLWRVELIAQYKKLDICSWFIMYAFNWKIVYLIKWILLQLHIPLFSFY